MCHRAYKLPDDLPTETEDIFFTLFRAKSLMTLDITRGGDEDETRNYDQDENSNQDYNNMSHQHHRNERTSRSSHRNERRLEPLPSIYKAPPSYEYPESPETFRTESRTTTHNYSSARRPYHQDHQNGFYQTSEERSP